MRVLFFVLSVMQAAAAQTVPSLLSLTPTAEELAGACELVPRPSEPLGGTRVRSGLWGPVPIPSNPWLGNDSSKVAAIWEIVAGYEGAVRLPDGPPPDRGRVEGLRHQAAIGAKGSAAAYRNGEERVLLFALQSPRLEAGALGGTVGPGGDSTVVFRTAGLWVRLTGTAGPCFDVLRSHIEGSLAGR